MFKSFFKKKNKKSNPINSALNEKVFSLTCLLVEAAMADEDFGEDEKKIIVNILRKQFSSVTNEDLIKTVDDALVAFNESSDLISYTRKIKEEWSLENRVEVIEMLWKVCLVDGVLEPYEDMIIRRVSGLIYVDDKNRKTAKSRAIKALNDNLKG